MAFGVRHRSLVFSGVGQIPPATAVNYVPWAIIGFIFQYVVRRKHFSYWANNLRFIEVPGIDITELDEFLNQMSTLYLTNKNDHLGETKYLAVLYCWDSFENSDGTQTSIPYSIQTDRGV